MKEREKYLGWGPAMFGVVTVLLIANLWTTWTVDREVNKVVQRVTIDRSVMVTGWLSKGITHKITTRLGEEGAGETDLEHAIRHNGKLVAMLRLFPRE